MDKMKKPRLCELLGVEVGEEWTIDNGATHFQIAEDGELLRLAADDEWVSAYSMAWAVLSVLNGNAKITRRSRWTEKDVEEAKAAKQLFPYDNMSVSIGYSHSRALWADDSVIVALSNRCFPSVRPGEHIPLDEILEAAP